MPGESNSSASKHEPERVPRCLNVAAWADDVACLGPGRRVALWLQGCCSRCPGCIEPAWQPLEPAHLFDISGLGVALVDLPDRRGLTLSGGEPLLQARGLLALLDLVQARRSDWDVILFTGLTLERIAREAEPARLRLITRADAVIAGPFLREQRPCKGLRGSANQLIHFKVPSRFTSQEQHAMLEHSWPRELHLQSRGGVLAGIPPLPDADMRMLLLESGFTVRE